MAFQADASVSLVSKTCFASERPVKVSAGVHLQVGCSGEYIHDGCIVSQAGSMHQHWSARTGRSAKQIKVSTILKK
jgi:hypothetical protein